MSKNKQSINVLRANLKKLRATTAAIFLIEEINIEGNRRDILKAIVAKCPFCGKETPIEVDTDTLEEFLVDLKIVRNNLHPFWDDLRAICDELIARYRRLFIVF